MTQRRAPRLPLRRYPDPAGSADPATRELLSALRGLETELPGPEPTFRTELRGQLVAVTPRLVREGADEPAATPRRSLGRRLRRPVGLAVAVVAVFAVLISGAVFLSRNAVPGDALYRVKRASENVQLSLATGDTDRGRTYLDQAKTRVGEATTLWTHAVGSGPPVVSTRTANRMSDTLDDADSDTRSGVSVLTTAAVHNRSTASLAVITAWAPGQIARLQAILAATPAGAIHTRATASLLLAAQATQRAEQLRAELGCACLSSGRTDQLGPLPCTSCNQPATRPTNPGSTHPATTGGAGVGTGSHPALGTGSSTNPTAGTGPTHPGGAPATSAKPPTAGQPVTHPATAPSTARPPAAAGATPSARGGGGPAAPPQSSPPAGATSSSPPPPSPSSSVCTGLLVLGICLNL